MTTIYDFDFEDALGQSVSMTRYFGKVIIIVNTASKCGFTPQYEGLQKLYNGWHDRGLEILAFPCNQFARQEQGSNAEIQEFCKLNYGLTFPVMAKIDVNGKNAHPLYQFLTSKSNSTHGGSIKWNFTKFVIGKHGEILQRFEPNITPAAMESFLTANI
jgi:glutathione peroxidase